MSVTVERASVASPQLVAALNALLPQLSTSAPSLTLEDVEAIVASDTSALFVASHEGRVVGTLTLIVYAVPMGRRGMIEDVVVDEGVRRMGVAEQLTRAAIDEARRRGAITIDLTSRPSREAANEVIENWDLILAKPTCIDSWLNQARDDETVPWEVNRDGTRFA